MFAENGPELKLVFLEPTSITTVCRSSVAMISQSTSLQVGKHFHLLFSISTNLVKRSLCYDGAIT